MIACCCQSPVDWTTIWPAIATIILSGATVFIAVFAYTQIGDIRNAIQQYSISATLQQEYLLLNKKNDIEIQLAKLNNLMVNRPKPATPEFHIKIESMQDIYLIEISNYLFSLDRYAFEVLTNKGKTNEGSALFFRHINDNLIKLFKLNNGTLESYKHLNQLLEQLRNSSL